ncbi:hypothetical protein K0M31_000263 [Melipona bicolor]|uniref:Uncharacterized protein n=1 Tax=Melipona bicolor TaxID=60889 RepID=A0AA40KWN3_9HYME|nr:hypothetical protein K0M31_000263 [Melipona bicolor]
MKHSPFTLAKTPEKKDKEEDDSNNINPRNHIMDIENLKVVDLSRDTQRTAISDTIPIIRKFLL